MRDLVEVEKLLGYKPNKKEKQEWEKVEGVLMKKLAEERESHRIAEEKLSTVEEAFDQASNAYMTLYYRHGWRGGRYRNDVKPQEFNNYGESVIPDPDLEDGEEGGTDASTSKGAEDGVP
ncbi:hypothetical protein WN944_000995 [Citrus x changshan-huyou]|uniref:Uncharacterized protein n=1 Tax=Citrus x changshan-huyou TaxID=2935761 RepID=A0AAP0MIW5_9ROSI